MDSPIGSFDRVLGEALNVFAERGYIDGSELEYWTQRLRDAAIWGLTPPDVLHQQMARHLEAVFKRTMRNDPGRVHRGLTKGDISQIEGRLKLDLQRRIQANASLIKLRREERIQQILARFSGWATSVPEGGGKTDKAEVRKTIKKSLRQMSFEERRVSIDQGHKLIASINRTIADQYGAIAVKWRHVHQAGYNGRPEHEERDGKYFLLKDTWATEKGLVKRGKNPYYENIDQVAQAPFCRCWAEFVYDITELPDDMRTRKESS